MTRESRPQRVDRALLFGVDCRDFITPNPTGCVGDVRQLAAWLVRGLGTSPSRVLALTTSLAGDEASEARATRAHIIVGFRRLAAEAQAGEPIDIPDSGHAMRDDTTILPGVEPDGRDEAIAPADSGTGDAALLSFGPDWSITRIGPDGDPPYQALKLTGDEGPEVQVLDAVLPPGVDARVDRLELFATREDRPTSFDQLTLESLDGARAVTRGGLRSPLNPLEQLLETMGTGAAPRELVRLRRTGDWGTAAFELHVTA
ncbi:MAG TPA: hypothetical protein VF590_13295 [Isosphaeraceae bacterium]|jgi:hypothetical protein